jgi:hypothetical protein
LNGRNDIETVELELIRPGPTHGQLLSPLTPYLALCGDDSPVTIHIGSELEHWKLLNRLRRLRYVTRDRGRGGGSGTVAVPDFSRESQLEELAEEVGRMLAAIPTLGRALGRAAGQDSELVHLRLLISGSELALIPFELLNAPAGYPAPGLPILLQQEMPIVLTRESRRGRPIHFDWNREPRILFISAAPGGMQVPAREHVRELRVALEPWIEWKKMPEERLVEVKKSLTVLPRASIKQIQALCAENRYTHVHILAHGGPYEQSGQTRYGVVLHHSDEGKEDQPEVVDGRTLAEALHAKYDGESGHSAPLAVSLATCDAGNVGSVVAPGASIAHDLHVSGVPWVFASQFPLTKRGSVELVRRLYGGLLWGRDPRRMSADLRRELHVHRRNDHDWASLVVYASSPLGFKDRIDQFRSRQFQRARDKELDQADQMMDSDPEAYSKSLGTARGLIQKWKKQLPAGSDLAVCSLRSECYGVEGATEKKIAELHHKKKDESGAQEALELSLDAYRRALEERPDAHWPATQCLSLIAILRMDPKPALWHRTYVLAEAGLKAAERLDRAWAYGTLAELEMLRTYHDDAKLSGELVVKAVRAHCRQIVNLVGRENFAVKSTKRQFKRYLDWWKSDKWKAVAEAAVDTFEVKRQARKSNGRRGGRAK